MRWLVALDVDGTLIDHDEVLSPAVRDAVQDVVAAGHHVVVATGRSLDSAFPVLGWLGLTGSGDAAAKPYVSPMVCSNGAVIVKVDPELPGGHELTDVVTFDVAPVLRLLVEDLPEAAFAVEDVGVGFKVAGRFPEHELTGRITQVPFEELLHAPASRVVVRSPEHTPEDFLEITSRLGLKGVNYSVGWTAWLDLAPEGVSKASALEVVRGRLGVDRAHTLAMGDGRNDLEMLRWAARGVAMGQAPAEVREAADEVTGSVLEDGAAAVLATLPR
ncbi:HAD family hydrolase [uncultured Pseudokineococcus sp.]|uniref:HAD family hydrolase n=1 Tax=uncultured Pseudokineococcus sp. TaxID=1642928 RepID=UPI0026262B28|nr:HAD family hydrolase [uncultured Pseudokineococcus sp.]